MNIFNSHEITFETKCYENDWEYVLKTKYLNKMIKNCNCSFGFKQLIINNVNQRDIVEYYARKKIKEGIIDAYYFVDDHIKEALKLFDISKESFGAGYYYSSAELVGIYVAKSNYLLHFASDSFLPQKDKTNWISDACGILEKNPDVVVANPVWNFRFDEAKSESENTENNFYIGYGFSDQCYLVRTNDFRAKIYNFKHPESERYPGYGGELFEKRIDAYMRVNTKKRITSMKCSYIHTNFPKKSFHRKLVKLLMLINMYNILNIIINKYIKNKQITKNTVTQH